MKKRGFTYIEVIIAIAIFAMLLTFVIKLDNTSNMLMKNQREKLRMVYVAQLALEKFKSNLLSIGDNSIEGYYVLVEGSSVDKSNIISQGSSSTVSVIEVKVTVKKNKNDLEENSVILFNDF